MRRAGYTLPPEQAFALADENSPAYLPGAFQLVTAVLKDQPKIAEAFHTGKGVGWHEHDPGLFDGTERFFRPDYAGAPRRRVDSGARRRQGEARSRRARRRRRLRPRRLDDPHGGGLPEVDVRRLRLPRGVDRLGAPAWPRRPVVRRSREVRGRHRQGVTRDAITTWSPVFDCLHDMGDPVGAASHVRTSLEKDGTWMIVEPQRRRPGRGEPEPDRPRLLLGLDARLHAGVAGAGGRAGARRAGGRGAPARGRDLRRVQPRFRRATETPFNMVLEARP